MTPSDEKFAEGADFEALCALPPGSRVTVVGHQGRSWTGALERVVPEKGVILRTATGLEVIRGDQMLYFVPAPTPEGDAPAEEGRTAGRMALGALAAIVVTGLSLWPTTTLGPLPWLLAFGLVALRGKAGPEARAFARGYMLTTAVLFVIGFGLCVAMLSKL